MFVLGFDLAGVRTLLLDGLHLHEASAAADGAQGSLWPQVRLVLLPSSALPAALCSRGSLQREGTLLFGWSPRGRAEGFCVCRWSGWLVICWSCPWRRASVWPSCLHIWPERRCAWPAESCRSPRRPREKLPGVWPRASTWAGGSTPRRRGETNVVTLSDQQKKCTCVRARSLCFSESSKYQHPTPVGQVRTPESQEEDT